MAPALSHSAGLKHLEAVAVERGRRDRAPLPSRKPLLPITANGGAMFHSARKLPFVRRTQIEGHGDESA